MAHTVRDKQKLLLRVRRIRGQIDALEKLLDQEADCSKTLHVMVACRGALNSLMAEVGLGARRWSYLAAAVVAGFPILRSCFESLRERRISVEVLVAAAIVTSLLVGEFHAGAVVAVMLLGGGVLEQITVARARRS